MSQRYEEQGQEPEPEEDVDLVIDHVDREDTQTIEPQHRFVTRDTRDNVLLLYTPGHAKVVERTFGNFWKYLHHRIVSLLVIEKSKVKHLETVARELSPE